MTQLLSLAAFAAPCPSGPVHPLDLDIGPDGSANLLVPEATETCWWVVDDGGDAMLTDRWPAGGRRPVAIEALADGRVALLMDDGRITVRDREGAARTLLSTRDRPPEVVLAHPDLPLLALQFDRGGDTARVWLVDADDGRVLASVAVPRAGLGLSFRPSEVGVRLEGSSHLLVVPGGTAALP
jgi:hypothetical protein